MPTSKDKKALLQNFKNLEKKIQALLKKIKQDTQKKAKKTVILKEKNALMFLLAESNYILRELSKFKKKIC